MREMLIMTPGPTEVAIEVREAMAKPILQPDIDPAFYDIYKETTKLLQSLMNTKEEVLILDGEGILGLEAACASLIEPGDRVLVLNNGIFGEGFGDFVTMYGGKPTYYNKDMRKPFEINELRQYLETNSDFKLATLVHCETPSGLVNPIDEICPLLKEYGILTVVDAVSSIGGIPIETDAWGIDVLLGGSQKCLSAPPGLTFLSLSRDAHEAVHNRAVPIPSFYANLAIWDGWYEKQWFPYTQPVSDIFALREAAHRLLQDENRYSRHRDLAQKTRKGLKELGFELYPEGGFSDTVTAFKVPDDMDEKAFRQKMMDECGIMITGAFGPLEGKVLRIGHMGENCRDDKISQTLAAIKKVMKL